ncbi:MAG: Glu-tRNA(Gln) amidotransferase subunit GatE [Candidatus Thermoplasmatota archaeon]|nr:Glu-tRNA(Gln) amidotransferase subunit GatE [Candidatus Thermoplasmatota archaeon]
MDYKMLGFKAGLEIHQQLDTHKLFCMCPSEITDTLDYSFERILRPTQSELGDIDTAALAEAKRNRRFLYTASDASTCLVEADEEPPHQPNTDAIDVCLTMALLCKAVIVDELHFMRKIVIDGSNTSGFQRTGLLAMNGILDDVHIQTIALEEDAARKIDQKAEVVTYGLDRLGIPLIEIATAPDMKDPMQARDVAENIGLLLRATGKVKRGLGTIRQDLNISIRDGERVEIKGIQSLSSIQRVAELETNRQLMLVDCKRILKERGKDVSVLKRPTVIDVKEMLLEIDSKMISKLLKHGVGKAVKLPGFAGLLKKEGFTLGRELAGYAKVASGIGGIIHSDELPGYGMTEEQYVRLCHLLDIDTLDAFVIALGKGSMVDIALDAVCKRALYAYEGVPKEVRRALPDDSTEYQRPLPGAARMYPETDVRPIRITKQRVERLQRNLPERPNEKLTRFIKQYQLNIDHIRQLLASGFESDFEELVALYPDLQQVIVRIYLNTIPELKEKGVPVERLSKTLIIHVLNALNDTLFSKEGVPTILGYLLDHPSATIKQAVEASGISSVDTKEVEDFTRNLIIDRADFVRQRGIDALGPLMGVVMKRFRGRVDGAIISDILKKELDRYLSDAKR